jgi:hypothetical protein
MNRPQLEHILRAAAAISGTDRFVVIGSQAVLGQYPDPPPELLISVEADIFSLRSPSDAELIDGSIGEHSQFHRTFGYYAHGVGEETATLPAGWKDRLVPFQSPATGGATGMCLEVNDLAVSKLVAAREKDITYVAALLRHELADADFIRSRLAATTLTEQQRTTCLSRLMSLETRRRED